MAGQPYRSLCLVAISAAGSFEFEAAIIRDIHLLVRVIDQKQVRADAQSAAPEAERLLCVSGFICDMGVRSCRDAGRHTAFARVQADVDFVIVKIYAGDE